MKKPKILYGVCGIGTGHTFRQLPIIEHFSKTSRLVIFAYGESYDFYSSHFGGKDSIAVERVAVPFYVGNRDGLDFEATARFPSNKMQDYLVINCAAWARAMHFIGEPDLVVTDYEPVSAQYAYAYKAPLVTIDQQSKYLYGDFPTALNGQTYQDEIMRLGMFFPRASARIATSFFNVQPKKKAEEAVSMYPPILRDSITKLRRKPLHKTNSILLYISAAREFVQSLEVLAKICASQSNTLFHIFVPAASVRNLKKPAFSNLSLYKHGDPRFYQVLQECTGIISTAGHTLLSEAMYLGIPVYAIPVATYEQHMNAYIIDKYGFGISHPRLDKQKLAYFIKNIPHFANSIKQDNKVLLRSPGQQRIIDYLEKLFLPQRA